MASRLLKSGIPVFIHDSNPSTMNDLAEEGAHKLESPQQVASNVETIFLSLPTPQIVQEVLLGPDGVIDGSRVKQVVDFSTIGPRVAKIVAHALRVRGISYVDAPVSGGVPGATNGKLAIMVSCPQATLSKLNPLFELLGKVFHVGEEAGQAQTMKLANNLLAAAAIAVSSEAMVMGVKAGINPQAMLEIINVSSGRNSATQDKFPRAILPGTFDFGFATGLAYKDVRLCIEEAESLGVPMVMGSAVREILAITNSLYGSESDYTSMCRVIESWAGVEVRSKPPPSLLATSTLPSS